MLYLTFVQGPPPNGRVYGASTEQKTTTLSVMDGKQVVLQRKSGKDYQLQAAPGSWTWAQVQQVAANETYIAVTPRILGEKVTVEVAYSNTQGDKSMAYTSTVDGEIGNWIPLLNSADRSNAENVKVYTAGDLTQQLSLKVEH